MTCRAPTSSTTCSGTQTGAQLSYDTEGRLASWQQSGTTISSLYDGEGNRVQQQVASSNPSTTTYIGNVEEVASAGGDHHKAKCSIRRLVPSCRPCPRV